MEYILYGSAGILALFGYTLYSVYNRLMALDERCNSAFSDIDVLLKHRHTLIPGLIETVKSYVGHEKGTLDSILNAQVEAVRAANIETRIQAEVQLGNNINSIFALAEKIPELEASQHYKSFRNELVDIENRVTASRRFYNTTVEELNSTVRQLPGSLVARAAKVQFRKPFDLGIERMLMEEPVTVKF